MEGRKPPPRATHPFPDNPDMTKFWGPLSRAVFRCAGVFSLVAGSYWGITIYLKRNDEYFMNVKINPTPEELEKKRLIFKNTPKIVLSGARVVLPVTNFDRHLQFDDGIKFDAPVDKVKLMTER